MVVEAIVGALAGALVLFVPGYLLTKAAWPRKSPIPELGVASIPLMAIVLSMGLTIVVGSILGFLPPPGKRGLFQTWRTGIPFVEMALLALSVAFFVVAARRGAFPRLTRKSREKGGLFAEDGLTRLRDRLKKELVDTDAPPEDLDGPRKPPARPPTGPGAS